MEVTTTRFENFSALFRQFREERATEPDRGMLKAFAGRLELSDKYLSHVKCGRKPIGHATARHIEEKLGLKPGWLDQRHDEETDPATIAEREFVQLALMLFRANPGEARAQMLRALRDRLEDKPKGGRRNPG